MDVFHSAAERVRIQSIALDMCASIDRWRVQFREIERKFDLNDAETKCRAFRWELAAFRFKSALLRYVGLDDKAGFRHDQPRWSAGSGRISGRWSGGGGGAHASDHTDFSSQRRDRRDGHHYLPRAHYRHLPLRPEIRKVFNAAKTGPLRVIHGWDEPHARYNEATEELMDRFLRLNKIGPEQMTPDHARSLIREIISAAFLAGKIRSRAVDQEQYEDQQAKQFEQLYQKTVELLARFGSRFSLSRDGDYSIYGSHVNYPQVKVTMTNLAMLHPRIVKAMQEVLSDFPGWAFVVAVYIRGAGESWPDMGLIIRAHEVVDGLQRQYFPKEFQSYQYEGSRRGTDRD